VVGAGLEDEHVLPAQGEHRRNGAAPGAAPDHERIEARERRVPDDAAQRNLRPPSAVVMSST
jgi:hypothetical protein